MKTSRITHYDPTLTIEQNAQANGVAPATVRTYIHTRHIDRAGDKKLALYNKVRAYTRANPAERPKEIAEALGLSANTVRKYLAMTAAPQPRKSKFSAVLQSEKVHFLSVSDDQTAILRSILAIHLRGAITFQCDLTAWKCGFYKNGIRAPYWLFDKYPQSKEVLPLDKVAEIADGFFSSVVVDLPTAVANPDSKRTASVCSAFPTMDELYADNRAMLTTAHRILETGGILVFKTMDFSFQNTPRWISDYVLQTAYSLGFELIDKYIYIDPRHNRLDRRRSRFTAAIPAHAYFFVLRKK